MLVEVGAGWQASFLAGRGLGRGAHKIRRDDEASAEAAGAVMVAQKLVEKHQSIGMTSSRGLWPTARERGRRGLASRRRVDPPVRRRRAASRGFSGDVTTRKNCLRSSARARRTLAQELQQAPRVAPPPCESSRRVFAREYLAGGLNPPADLARRDARLGAAAPGRWILLAASSIGSSGIERGGRSRAAKYGLFHDGRRRER